MKIKSKGIPMTAPVEMTMREGENNDMQMEEMAFLYQNTQVGKTGGDGDTIVVRDVPAQEALSYAWQGLRSKSSIARARPFARNGNVPTFTARPCDFACSSVRPTSAT